MCQSGYSCNQRILEVKQLALFDLVQRVDLGSADRERIKMCSRELLAGVLAPIAQLDRWSENLSSTLPARKWLISLETGVRIGNSTA